MSKEAGIQDGDLLLLAQMRVRAQQQAQLDQAGSSSSSSDEEASSSAGSDDDAHVGLDAAEAAANKYLRSSKAKKAGRRSKKADLRMRRLGRQTCCTLAALTQQWQAQRRSMSASRGGRSSTESSKQVQPGHHQAPAAVASQRGAAERAGPGDAQACTDTDQLPQAGGTLHL
jgi:hypothetical protein